LSVVGSSSKFINRAVLKISKDANTYVYAGAKNIRFFWGNRQLTENLLDSDIPIVLTGEFEGSFEADLVGSTDDNQLLSWSTPDSTTREVPTLTVNIEEKALDGTVKTWTLKGKINRIEHSKRATDPTLTFSISMVLVDRPTVG